MSFYGASKEEARRKGLKRLGFIGDGDTVSDFYFDAYLPSVLHLRPGTLRKTGWAMDKHFLPVFGKKEIASVTRKELQAFFNKLAASGLAGTTVCQVKKAVSGVFALAEVDEVVVKNLVPSVRLAPSSAKEVEPLTFEEARKLLDLPPGWLRNAVLLMLMGIRAGEACGAAWSDVTNLGLHVHRQSVQTDAGWATVGYVKTPQSDRTVPLPKEFLALMVKTGPMIVPDTNPPQLWRALKAHGVRPHQLRHTFISLMENELEAPRRVVAQIAGKAKASEMDRYSKSNVVRRQEWADRYAKAVVQGTPVTGLQVAGG